ncbi:MAG: hypothetical protein K2I78_04365, partial [Clostridia bacterium]|nr:hypothetical protein [Clostridia bacterium]
GKLPYNGGDDVEFQLVYDENYAKVSYKGVDLSTTSKLVSEKTVDKYELTVELLDNENYEWSNKKDKLIFEITTAKVYIKLSDINSGTSSLSGLQGISKKFNLELHQDSNKRPKKTDEVPVSITASATDLPTLTINVEDIVLTKDSTTMQITFNMSKLRAVQYKLNATTTNGNYEIVIEPAATLDVKSVEEGSTLRWYLNKNGVAMMGDWIVDAEVGNLESELFEHLTYERGNEYTFTIGKPTGYEIDEEYGIKTVWLKTDGSEEEIEKAVNAGEYKTTVKLKDTTNPSNVQEYFITWTIDKAKFDLTNVKWQYPDGKLPYTQGGISAVIDERTLPAGLKVNYTNSTIKGNTVGQKGSESITFELDVEYKNNYVLPEKDKPDSYDGTFTAWIINWEVVKAVITANWKTTTKTDTNGVEYTVWELDTGNYPSNIITYRYYEVNSESEIKPETPYITEIVVEDKVVKTYIAQAVFSSDNGDKYELSGKEYSNPFGVGTYTEEVEIDLRSKELTYNGSAQEVSIQIKKGAISADSFEIAYYDKNGTTELAEVPVNVGKYRVEIKIKESVSGYYLTGENVVDGVAIIEYEIKQMEIK